jgi:hypothetical protein
MHHRDNQSYERETWAEHGDNMIGCDAAASLSRTDQITLFTPDEWPASVGSGNREPDNGITGGDPNGLLAGDVWRFLGQIRRRRFDC